MARHKQDFQTIRSEGSLLPADFMRRILDPNSNLAGMQPADYGISEGDRLNEVITNSWTRLRKLWADFRKAAQSLPPGEAGTGLTNDKWSLPLLRELGFGMLPTTASPELVGRTYAIRRFFGPVPIHLIGCGLSLDRRAAGQRGAVAANPHGLVQEFLNRSDRHLWAIVSNGLCLRILRDNQALSRQSYLEFDLEAMFDCEIYSDFVLFWLLSHATRFAPREGDRPETCRLEEWTKEAQKQGTRALGDLRSGVERALQILGEGFTSHPKNNALREALRTNQISAVDFHGRLLRIVYRLIFLFVSEDRTLDGQPILHPRDYSESARVARSRYAEYYSTARLRDLAGKIKGSRHGDLWRQFQHLLNALSGDDVYAKIRENLTLPALGSFLWRPATTALLNEAELTNFDFLEALRNLAFTRTGKTLCPVDYKNLGAEELGGIYESLLALTPQISADGACFSFAEFAGNERKTSGSYYTPDSLVQCLLDSALDPVVEEAIRGKTGTAAEKAILGLKVCDPAVGSGHFLVGAAHRLARHLARVHALAEGESEPSPLLYQHALRDVISRCLYGVDINPMAAELCRVSLWLEALEPGLPLSFLDHHIRVGNSLLGATPELIAEGIPDEAFTAIEGDDKKACTKLKKRNRVEREGMGELFVRQEQETQARLQAAAAVLEELPDNRPEEVRAKESAFRSYEQNAEYSHKKLLADAWCAAFVIKKEYGEQGRDATVKGITQKHLVSLAEDRPLPSDQMVEIERLSTQYQFFHWYISFPEVFAKGGFDCILGNPPWRMTEDDSRIEQEGGIEFQIDSESYGEPTRLKRERAFFTRSGRFPLSAQNRLQLARLFAELFGTFRAAGGSAGMIVPSTLTVNAFDRPLWTSWLQNGTLSCVWDFVNMASLFPEVDSRQKFAIICLRESNQKCFRARCWLTDPAQIMTQKDQIIELTDSDLFRYSGPELALPHFRGRMDLALLDNAISAFGRVSGSKDWAVEFVLLGATNDPDFVSERRRASSPDDKSEDDFALPAWIPVYEGKMVGIFDHRLAQVVWNAKNAKRRAQEKNLTDLDKADPNIRATPLWEVPRSLVASRDSKFAQRGWDIAICDVTSALNERTVITAMVPFSFTTHNLPLVRVSNGDPISSTLFLATLASFPLDYFARLRVATNHLTEGIFNSLPIPSPKQLRDISTTLFVDERWIFNRALEMTYTAWDLQPFAKDCGWAIPPFCWDEERRFFINSEIDAILFHLYLPSEKNGDWRISEGKTSEVIARLKSYFPKPRDAVAYIMDTFPIIRRKDEEKYDGDFRTKRVILEIYDAMQESIRTGQPYRTRLYPPPADPRCCHPPKDIKGGSG